MKYLVIIILLISSCVPILKVVYGISKSKPISIERDISGKLIKHDLQEFEHVKYLYKHK